jgi:hypothetical protein
VCGSGTSPRKIKREETLKHLLLLSIATFSVASADVTLGTEMKQGAITVLMTRYSNRPFAGMDDMPQPPPEFLREGVMVIVNSANATTAAYRITLKYRSGDSIVSVQQTAIRSDSPALPGTPVIFAIGKAAAVSVLVEEYAPPQTAAEFKD